MRIGIFKGIYNLRRIPKGTEFVPLGQEENHQKLVVMTFNKLKW